MRVALIDLNVNFYDRHWAYAMTAVLRKPNVKDIVYVMASVKPPFYRKMASLKPDLVLYNAFSYNLAEAITFDRHLKSMHPCQSVVGGPGPTFAQVDIHQTTLDAMCIGEGELAIQDYIESGLTSGRNLITRDHPNWRPAPLLDLALAPMPDRSVVYQYEPFLAKNPIKHFMSGRGCPYHCTYCFNHAFNKMFGTQIRKRPVQQVMDELLYVKNSYGLNFVSFQDDTFCMDKDWLVEFVKSYKDKIHLPLTCNVRPNLVDKDIVKLLKEVGARGVSWSVESANDGLRNHILKRHISKEQMNHTMRLFRQAGIDCRLANVIGIPGENKDQINETIDYNVSLHPAFATANPFTPYPKLELTEYALSHGYLDPQDSSIQKTFFAGSALKGDKKFHRFIIKSYCLLPFFVWFPILWRKKTLRKLVYAIPKSVLRIIYEGAYLKACQSLYGLKTSPRIALTMAWRYLKSLDILKS